MARAFTEPEHRARLDRARAAIAEAGLDAAVTFAPEHLYYYAGYDAHTQFSIQALIIGTEGEPAIILRDVDRANAEESCWLGDQRFYHHGQHDPADLIAAALAERTGPRGRVGLCLNSYALPGAFALHLAKRLGRADALDVTALLERVRYVKSEAEMAHIRAAAAIAERGLARLRASLAPGMSEITLAGLIESAMREAGSEYPAMPCWLSSGPRTRGSHRTPTTRTIGPGEPVKCEFAGVVRRYHAVTMQTLWCGEPSAEARRTYDAALASLRAGCRAIAIGVPVTRAEEAAFGPLRQAGFATAAHMRFGYGVSAAYPPTWLEGLDITRESPEVFQRNMAFVLHSYATSADGVGIMVGGAYALTDKGLETLSGGDVELTVA
ncbi:MAG: Xaa-Pro peptidase family protein [Alphaproteobacteria bacterium]